MLPSTAAGGANPTRPVAARFGKTYAGAPDVLAEQLAAGAAVQAADTLLVRVPNQLGVDFNAKMLGNIARYIAPAVGWTPAVPDPAQIPLGDPPGREYPERVRAIEARLFLTA